MDNTVTKPKVKVGKIFPLMVIGIGLLILAVVLVVVFTNRDTGTNYSVVPSKVDFNAPKLALNDLTGSMVDISDYRDKIVMINNWATWCPPCKDELPTLEKYYNAHKKDGFILFGIEAGDPKDNVSSFVKEHRLSYPILLDPNNKSLTLFQNDSLPSSYVIDHDGNVVLAWTGPISLDMLEKYVTPLLEQ